MKRLICVQNYHFSRKQLETILEKAAVLGFETAVFDSGSPNKTNASGFDPEAYPCMVSGETGKAGELFGKAEIIYGRSLDALRAAKGRLRWFCCMNAGVESFTENPDAFPSPDVLLTNSNVYGRSISEHVLLFLFMLYRNMLHVQDNMERGIWERSEEIDSVIGNRFLILGTGDLGLNIALRLKALGAGKIIGMNRSGKFGVRFPEDFTEEDRFLLRKEPFGPFDEIRPVSELHAVLPDVTTVILAVPAVPGTERLIGERELALLPDGSYFVNVGRGSTLDEDALLRALMSGKLKGAALDVMEKEPVTKESRLFSARNLILTPHISGTDMVAYTLDLNCRRFLEDLERYAKGEPLHGFVDRKRGY